MRGHLLVAAHRVGHPGARAQAGEGGADEREEHREGLHKHEGLARRIAAEEPRADDDHHVADGGAGCAGHPDRVAIVQQIVRGEVLDQVAHQALDAERQEHGARDVALGVLGLLAHRGHGFEADQDEDGDAGLDEHEVEAVWRDDGAGAGVEVEGQRVLLVAGLAGDGLIGRVTHGERSGELRIGDRIAVLAGRDRVTILVDGIDHLEGRLAGGIDRGLAVSVEHGHGLAGVILHHLLGHDVVDGDTVGEVVAGRALRVLHAVRNGDEGEYQERGDLDDVDRHVDRGGAGHAAEGDVGDAQREHDAEPVHEQRAVVGAAESVREELGEQVTAQQRGDADHASGIDPVVEMTGPARDELGDARELESLGLRGKGLFGIEVGGAGAGIDLGEFGVADGGGEAQDQGQHYAEPHCTACHRGAVQRLYLEGKPEEGAGCDQRHGIDGQTGQAQGGLGGRRRDGWWLWHGRGLGCGLGGKTETRRPAAVRW